MGKDGGGALSQVLILLIISVDDVKDFLVQ